MTTNYAHTTANGIERGMDRSKASRGGKKVLKELEKNPGEEREKALFHLLLATIIERTGLQQEDIKKCQQLIVTEFYQNGCSVSDHVVDTIILGMCNQLGLSQDQEKK